MAMRLDAGQVGRGDMFAIDPEHVIADAAHNSRSVPHTAAEVESLARSIAEHGQAQPVLCRKVDGHKVQLVAGFGRHSAVLWANANLGLPAPLKLLCRVIECNDEEAFLKSLVENLDRADTTTLDDAHAQRRLR